jgi:hypothetical protein
MRETQGHLKYICYYRILPGIIRCGLEKKHFSPEMIHSDSEISIGEDTIKCLAILGCFNPQKIALSKPSDIELIAMKLFVSDIQRKPPNCRKSLTNFIT